MARAPRAAQEDAMKVEDLMSTALISVRATATVTAARNQMELAGIRHLPVTDEHGHLVGILSNRDLLGAVAQRKGATRVSRVMSANPVRVAPSNPAHEAAALMLEHKFGALPVVGDEQQLIGIVTETDFLSVAHHALLGQSLKRG
jgi:CBS domain-containing protein